MLYQILQAKKPVIQNKKRNKKDRTLIIFNNIP